MTRLPLRVVAWNVNQGLEAKSSHLLDLQPDIAVISECADIPNLGGGALVRAAWTGRNPRKGLGIFVRPGIAATIDPSWEPWREWWLPLRVETTTGQTVDVLGVWAFNRGGQEPGPVRGRTHRALEHYRSFLEGQRAVVIGDFNNNVRWDTPSQPTFRRTVGLLDEAGYVSVYHERTGEPQGAETGASFYWYRHLGRPYLIDHAFVPRGWLGAVQHFELGDPGRWLAWSDHVPLVLDLLI